MGLMPMDCVDAIESLTSLNAREEGDGFEGEECKEKRSPVGERLDDAIAPNPCGDPMEDRALGVMPLELREEGAVEA